MTLLTRWPGVRAAIRQSIATAGVVAVMLLAAPLAPLIGLQHSAFLVAGMGAVTVSLAEGVLGVQPAQHWRERTSNLLFAAVLGPILAWLSGLVSTVVLWETGLGPEDFALWMLLPGNIATWLAILAFAYFRGTSVRASPNNSAGTVGAVESAA